MIKRKIKIDYTITFTEEALKELYEILVMGEKYDRINELNPLYCELNKMYHTEKDHLQDLG